MRKALYRFEFMQFIQNKKNVLFLLLFVLTIVFYVIYTVPTKEETYENHQLSLQVYVDSWTEFYKALVKQEKEQNNRYSEFNIKFYENMVLNLTALQNKDIPNYIESSANHYRIFMEGTQNGDVLIPENYLKNFKYSFQQVIHDYNKSRIEFEALSAANNINFSEIYALTSFQQMRLWIQQLFPYFLLLIPILYANDIFTKDIKHKTIMDSVPVSLYQQVNMKSFIVFIFAFGSTIFIILSSLVVMAIRNGWGSLYLPVTRFIGDEYDVISTAMFFVQSFCLLILAAFFLIRLCMVFSLLFRNEFITLFLGVALLFSERVYQNTFFIEMVDVSILPNTYFDMGNVITGDKAVFYQNNYITFLDGVIVLATSIIVAEVALYIFSTFRLNRFLPKKLLEKSGKVEA
ncbi:hypothetical protein [Psychrobacillus sp. L4]|uniref:hypothetical protein n=1 Tax=Psychrobacillus sp. L4 TaxID=3236892 RepID=UPI0036F2BA1D